MVVPSLKIKKKLTDKQVSEKMRDFWNQLEGEIKRPSTHKSPEIKSEISPSCTALLFYLSRYPFTKAGELKNAPGFKSVAEADKALEWLENNEFVKTEQYRTSRTKKSNYSVLQEKAFEYLGIQGHPGKGFFEHKLYQNIISEKLFQENDEVKIEGRMKNSKKLMLIVENN